MKKILQLCKYIALSQFMLDLKYLAGIYNLRLAMPRKDLSHHWILASSSLGNPFSSIPVLFPMTRLFSIKCLPNSLSKGFNAVSIILTGWRNRHQEDFLKEITMLAAFKIKAELIFFQYSSLCSFVHNSMVKKQYIKLNVRVLPKFWVFSKFF